MSSSVRPGAQSRRTFLDIIKSPRHSAMDVAQLGLEDGRTTLIHSKETPLLFLSLSLFFFFFFSLQYAFLCSLFSFLGCHGLPTFDFYFACSRVHISNVEDD